MTQQEINKIADEAIQRINKKRNKAIKAVKTKEPLLGRFGQVLWADDHAEVYYYNNSKDMILSCPFHSINYSTDYFWDSHSASIYFIYAKPNRLKLERKIAEINRDNNWKENFNQNIENYYLEWDCIENCKSWDYELKRCSSSLFMCEEAKNYMLSDAVSDAEFKLFLGIKE